MSHGLGKKDCEIFHKFGSVNARDKQKCFRGIPRFQE